ncbi:type II toxin-antitoxin system YafQ family toxin [Candidatus Rickettsia kedanie]
MQAIVNMLVNNIALPQKYRPHKLITQNGNIILNLIGYLIYEIKKDTIILYRTGTYADLF